MGIWLDQLTTATRPPLWLADTAYSERLLANGSAPWLDVAALVSWRNRVHALLKPDIAVLDLAPLTRAWIEANPGLKTRMGEKQRPVGPLRVLQADAGLRRHVAETLAALRAGCTLPLALTIPSPRRWVAEAWQAVFGQLPAATGEQAEAAALYCADFLRSFGQSGLDVLLLEDDERTTPANVDEIGWYQAVVNVARYYRWDIGLRALQVIPGDHVLDFQIAPQGSAGIEIGPGFWEGESPPAASGGGFYYLTIAPDAKPEAVMQQLARVR